MENDISKIVNTLIEISNNKISNKKKISQIIQLQNELDINDLYFLNIFKKYK